MTKYLMNVWICRMAFISTVSQFLLVQIFDSALKTLDWISELSSDFVSDQQAFYVSCSGHVYSVPEYTVITKILPIHLNKPLIHEN